GVWGPLAAPTLGQLLMMTALAAKSPPSFTESWQSSAMFEASHQLPLKSITPPVRLHLFGVPPSPYIPGLSERSTQSDSLSEETRAPSASSSVMWPSSLAPLTNVDVVSVAWQLSSVLRFSAL